MPQQQPKTSTAALNVVAGNKYAIKEALGCSNNAVLNAHHVNNEHKQFAVKLRVIEDPANPVKISQTWREYFLGVILDHPNVAATYEFIAQHPVYWTIMQKVHGDSLYNFIKKLHASDASMAVKEKAAKKIAFDLTLALEYLHENRCFHGDMKSANVIVDYDHETFEVIKATIIDLDCADFCSAEGNYDRSGILGTHGYMAPECFKVGYNGRPMNRWRGPELDRYSLGIIIFEVLFGKLPFPNLRKYVDPTHPNHIDVVVTLPEDLEELFPDDPDASFSIRQSLRSLGYFREDIKPILDSISADCKNILQELLRPSPQYRERNPETALTCSKLLRSEWFAELPNRDECIRENEERLVLKLDTVFNFPDEASLSMESKDSLYAQYLTHKYFIRMLESRQYQTFATEHFELDRKDSALELGAVKCDVGTDTNELETDIVVETEDAQEERLVDTEEVEVIEVEVEVEVEVDKMILTKEIEIQTEAFVETKEMEIQTKACVEAKEMEIQTEATIETKEIETQTMVNTEEIEIQVESNMETKEIEIQTEVIIETSVAQVEAIVETKETEIQAMAGLKEVQVQANVETIDFQIQSTNETKEIETQTMVKSKEIEIQTEKPMVINELTQTPKVNILTDAELLEMIENAKQEGMRMEKQRRLEKVNPIVRKCKSAWKKVKKTAKKLF